MLKKLRVLFLGLVVLAGSACVTPTHASSAFSVVITYIQAGGSSGAKEEIIVVYNNSSIPVDLTDWCLVNKSNVAFACLASDAVAGEVRAYTLPAYSYLTVASEEYAAQHEYPDDFYSLIYPVTSQGSGSIVGSSEHIRLVDGASGSVDERSWTQSISSGEAWRRTPYLTEPDMYIGAYYEADWQRSTAVPPPESGVVVDSIPDSIVPEEPIVAPALSPVITEILPNPSGPDAGLEYIELHNPHAEQITTEYFNLRIGTETPKVYELPIEFIEPGGYRVFYDGELPFTLTNTTGRVQLFYGDIAAGEPVEYVSAKDDAAWAVIGGVWQYTKLPTPGAENALPVEVPKATSTSTKKPCNANQFRNPETGRCKLISATTSTRKPCRTDQYRSPETNRCRSIAASSTELKPCKEGQERNAETNRCRNIKKMTDTDYQVQGVRTAADNQPRWYYWIAIVAVVGLIAAYAIWEWRVELQGVWQRITRLFHK